MSRPPIPVAERFWKFIHKTSTCWLWTGHTNKGYGQFWRKEGAIYAHCFAWEQHHKRKIPEGKKVCHTCDNRACVRIDHLWLGTQKQNIQDAVKKGRMARNIGKKNGMFGKYGPLNPMWGKKRKHTAASRKKMSISQRKRHEKELLS